MNNKIKQYKNVSYFAETWNLSERSIRNYCANNRIDGAVLKGKTWLIPIDTVKPDRINKTKVDKNYLLDRIKKEKTSRITGSIYHRIQIDLTYNSNHIEGSKLTHEETRYIFDTKTIGISKNKNIDDVVETVNHFKCVDTIIDNVNYKLS